MTSTRVGPSRRGLWPTLLAGVAAVSLLASACSSEEPAAAEDKVVTIGVIAPLENGLTSYGRGIANSVLLAAAEANARDAIPGYTIEVQALDDSSDPAVGRAAAERIATNPTVIGVVGTYNSGVAAEVMPVLDAAGITMISPANTDPTLSRGPDPVRFAERVWPTYFRMVATDAEQGPLLASYAYDDLAARSIAVVTEPKPVSAGLADDFSGAVTQEGATVSSLTTLPDDPAAYDLPGVAATVAAANPDLVFFGGEYDVASQFKTALAAAGYTGPMMGGDGMKDDAYITGAGSFADGDIASTVGVPNSSLDAPDYFAAYTNAAYVDPPTDYGPYAFDAANLLIETAKIALEGQDGVNATVRAKVRDEVAAAQFGGITGQVAFNEFGDSTNKVFTVFRVTDGAWKPSVTRQVYE
jgi:branched-chain amino acid transport system substrate-binding protein